jgi:hypothetical protein
MFCFSIQEANTSISIAAGSVTGILAYRFVIANMSPKVGYFVFSDYLFFLFLTMSTLVFLVNISDIFYHNISLHLKRIILFLIHIATNFITAYFIFN